MYRVCEYISATLIQAFLVHAILFPTHALIRVQYYHVYRDGYSYYIGLSK